MPDIQINYSQAAKTRTGATPVSLPNIIGTPTPPVGPVLGSVAAGAGLSIDAIGQVQLGNNGVGVIDISNESVFSNGFKIESPYLSVDGLISSANYLLSKSQLFFSLDSFLDDGTFFNSTRSLQFFLGTDQFSIGSAFVDDTGSVSTNIRIYGQSNSFESFADFIIESNESPFDQPNKEIGLKIRKGNTDASGSAVFIDSVNSKGLEYADDYEANFTDRSLVTKQYVDGASGGISGSIAEGQVAFGTGINALGGDSSMSWNNSLKTLTINGASSGVAYPIRLNSTALATRFVVDSTNVNANSGLGLAQNGTLKWSIASYLSTGDLTFYNDGLTFVALHIKGNTNNIGIFTDSPTERLDVVGNIRTRGNLLIDNTRNIVLGTGAGTRFGTATNQRLGFWNATPIIQPTTSIASADYVHNSANAIHTNDTFDGYTVAQIVKALRNSGLLA